MTKLFSFESDFQLFFYTRVVIPQRVRNSERNAEYTQVI